MSQNKQSSVNNKLTRDEPAEHFVNEHLATIDIVRNLRLVSQNKQSSVNNKLTRDEPAEHLGK